MKSLQPGKNEAGKILVLHGPNLNLLGWREPSHYGHDTLEQIDSRLKEHAADAGVALESFQSNSESELVERVQQTRDGNTRFIIINPAAFTHTSVAIADAIAAIQTPVVEVHISNIYAREEYRHVSLTGKNCKGVLTGFGLNGYRLALESFLK